ncbi:hypothetical protein BGX28_009951, partial [Mortierella sp. GBA30]
MPLTKRQKHLKEARRIHSEIRKAIKLSITPQVEVEEAVFDEHSRDWEEILASDTELERIEGDGGGEDEGEN